MIEPSIVVSQTASDDPEVGLRGVASLRALLEAVEQSQVRRARELGWSWQQIAGMLGVSKQAAHQKYAQGERRRRPQPIPAGQKHDLIEPAAADWWEKQLGHPVERR